MQEWAISPIVKHQTKLEKERRLTCVIPGSLIFPSLQSTRRNQLRMSKDSVGRDIKRGRGPEYGSTNLSLTDVMSFGASVVGHAQGDPHSQAPHSVIKEPWINQVTLSFLLIFLQTFLNHPTRYLCKDHSQNVTNRQKQADV